MALREFGDFPRQDVPDKEKASKAYGLKVAKAMEGEWWSRDLGTTNYIENREEFHRRRLYARGEQDIRYYKDWFAQNGDLSYVNLDWNPVPIIPKFVDIMVNGMQDRLFKIKAQAIDPIATEKRAKFVEQVQEDMATREVIAAWGEEIGVDISNVPAAQLPENTEELDLYMNLNYKQGVEIAIEQGVDNIFHLNNYPETKAKLDRDLVVCGIAVAKHSFNNTDGIKVEYVDPADFIYSRGGEDPNFNDIYYAGEVKRIRVNELVKQFPELANYSGTSSKLKKILDRAANYDEYEVADYNYYDQSDSNTLNVLYFEWKTFNKSVHKVKETGAGTDKAIEKDDSFNPPPSDNYERVEQAVECIYEGVYILGMKELLSWKKATNQVREQGNMNRVCMNYTAVCPKWYKGRIESHVDRMIPFADLIQQTYLKLQQTVQKMTPAGVFLDADGLAEIDLGNGEHYSAREALNMYFQTGSVIGRSLTSEGDPNPGKIPIQELPGSNPTQLEALIGYMNFNIDQIRAVTGVNEARDGSDPDQYSLVGVQKLAAANSNTATRHILHASNYITKKLAEGICVRFKDVIEFHPAKESFIGAIGRFSVGSLEELINVPLHEFGIQIELEPDEEEKQLVEANIQAALAKDQILLADAIAIRQIKNTKLANEYLKVRFRKKQEQDQQNAQANAQSQAEAQAQAQQAIEQAKAQAESIKNESKIAVEQAKVNSEIKKIEVEAQQKKELMMLEFELNMRLKQMELNMAHNTEMAKIAGQAGEQGNQGPLSGPPKSPKPKQAFESRKNDTIEGGQITTNQFEPK